LERIAVGGLILTGRLSRSGMKLWFAWVDIAVPSLVVWLVAAGALFAGVTEQRLGLLLGSSWKSCPRNIAAPSLPLFIATFWCVKDRAPTRLAPAGAADGLLSGALRIGVFTALHRIGGSI
jgi:hypothetical protein